MKRKILRGLLFTVLFLTALVVYISQSDIWVKHYGKNVPATKYRATSSSDISTAPDSIRVMTWNIKFAGGRIDFFFDCYGNRVLMDRAEVLANLDGIIKKINNYQPDILMLQEVDVDSKRSAYIDMVQYLLDKTSLNYGAYASQWDVKYVPSNGIGRINSGNAILSKWPIASARRIALPRIKAQDAITRFFYLQRNILSLDILFANERKLTVLNTHLVAYAKDNTRSKQIDVLQKRMSISSQDTATILLAGGDLNALTPGTKKLKNFDDCACTDDFVMDDYTSEKDILLPLYSTYSAAIPMDIYQKNEGRYYTHTVRGDGFWNRKVDHLFTNRSWSPGSTMVHQDTTSGSMPTMPLSDHAPITGVLFLDLVQL